MKTVALIFGGQSPEHEVSIVSARFVRDTLVESGFDVLPIGIDINGQWHSGDDVFDYLCDHAGDSWSKSRGLENMDALGRLCGRSVDVVFPLIHGITGEDGCIQGLLEMCHVPYVGGGPLNQTLCFDKITTRQVLHMSGLPQPKFEALYRRAFDRLSPQVIDELVAKLGFPVFVKPSRTGSSIGVNKAVDRSGLESALEIAFTFDSRAIVEQAVEGMEIEVAAIGAEHPDLSVPAEIITKNEFYDFAEKYLQGTTRFDIPAQLTQAQKQAVLHNATRAWQVLHCYGMARIDFLVAGDTAFVNEVNTTPGFTSISMYPALLEKDGMASTSLVTRLVELAETRFYSAGRKSVFCSDSDWYKES